MKRLASLETSKTRIGVLIGLPALALGIGIGFSLRGDRLGADYVPPLPPGYARDGSLSERILSDPEAAAKELERQAADDERRATIERALLDCVASKGRSRHYNSNTAARLECQAEFIRAGKMPAPLSTPENPYDEILKSFTAK